MNEFQRTASGMFLAFILGVLVTLMVAETPQPIVQAVGDSTPSTVSAPAVALVPAQEAKAEPAAGVSTTPRTEPVAPLPSDGAGIIQGPSDSGVEPLRTPESVPPESVSAQDSVGDLARLKDAIAAYRASCGVRYFVRGKTDAQHLIDDHGWTSDQIAGLTTDELQLLHGASHTGKLHPADFASRPPGAAGAHSPSAAPGAKPVIRIISPATWDCPWCPSHRDQDWSGFDVTFENRDGLSSYPCTEWQDPRGVTRRLYGKRTPQQVLWSYKKTCE